jgi:hypothetical protein
MTEQLLHFNELVARFRVWVEWYNAERSHGALDGLVPLQAWPTDPSEITRYTDLGALRQALLRPSETRTVDKNGISFRGRYYTDAALDMYVGERVQIGYIEERPESIEVFTDNKWRATAKWDRLLTGVDRGRMQRSRQAAYETVSRVNLAATLVSADASRAAVAAEPDPEPLAAVAGDDAAEALDILLAGDDVLDGSSDGENRRVA